MFGARALTLLAIAVIVAPVGSGASRSQTAGPQVRALCADDALRASRLAAVRNERERGMMALELADSCAQIDLPSTPVHDTADPRPEASHSSWVFDARFAPDGRTIASASRDGTVRFWDVATGQHLRHVVAAEPFRLDGREQLPAVRRLVFVGDGSRVVSMADGDQNRIIDVTSGKVIARMAYGHAASGGFPPALAATRSGVMIASGDPDVVEGTELATMRSRFRLSGHRERSPAIAVSEPADLIATARGRDPGRAVLLWRLDTGEKRGEFTPPGREINDLAFSRDGTRLAVTAGGSVHVYQTTDARLLRTFSLHPFSIPFDVAFAPDGAGLLTCMRHPILWDIATGRQLRHFGPFTDLCHSIDISPDGRFMVTTAMGSDIRIWDIATGTFHRRLGHNLLKSR